MTNIELHELHLKEIHNRLRLGIIGDTMHICGHFLCVMGKKEAFDDELNLIGTNLDLLHSHTHEFATIPTADMEQIMRNVIKDKTGFVMPDMGFPSNKEDLIELAWRAWDDIVCSNDRQILDNVEQSINTIYALHEHMFTTFFNINLKNRKQELINEYVGWNFETKQVKV